MTKHTPEGSKVQTFDVSCGYYCDMDEQGYLSNLRLASVSVSTNGFKTSQSIPLEDSPMSNPFTIAGMKAAILNWVRRWGRVS